jgi:outer membrane murein-binding lipoprotein Lpp
MFLNKKQLFAAFSAIVITGCVSTIDTEQQQKITNLESSLTESTTMVQQTQSELQEVKKTLKIKQEKIANLTTELKKIQTHLQDKNNTPAKQTAPVAVTHANDKTILGQSEWVYVSTLKDNFKGRIDTGAATSSINAVDIERFERDGEKWVRFNITHAEGGKAQMLEAKIERIAKIVQSSKPGEETERPVVKLHVRIGDISHLSEFTLTNRLHMEYPVLIGRTFMQDVVLVDVSKEYIFPKYQSPAETK